MPIVLVPKCETAPGAVAEALARFAPEHRPAVAACAALSPRLAQLAATHPFLLLAIATGYGARAGRRRAVELVAGGAPLAEACAASGIPMCFRHIPPEGCIRPALAVTWSAPANRWLAPHVPKQPTVAARWLAGVTFASAASDEAFAIWLARWPRLFEEQGPVHAELLPLALYAWCSRFVPQDVAWCISPPWSAVLGLPAAVTRAASFASHIHFVAQFGRETVRDAWLAEQEAFGHRFVPLLTPSDLMSEAQAMSSCVTSYSYAIAADQCRLFSMRRGGQRVATIEIRPTPDGRRFAIAQIKGPMNEDCPLEHLEAAHRWIEATRFQPRGRVEVAVRDDPAIARLERMIGLWRASRPAPLADIRTDVETLRDGALELRRRVVRAPQRSPVRRPA